MSARIQQPKLIILMYHAVVSSRLSVPDWCFLHESEFRRQIEYLASTRQVVSLATALSRGEKEVADGTRIAITFDDGFRNNYDVAFPILERFETSATIFIPTAFIGGADCLWFCKVNRAVATTRQNNLQWDGAHYDLSSARAREHASAQIQARIKQFPQPQLQQRLRELCNGLGDDVDQAVPPESPYAVLDHGAMQRMQSSGLIDFGAHTHTHAILSLLDSEQRNYEIRQSVGLTSELTAKACELFAYPNGRPQDYDAESIAILRELGVGAAVTVIAGSNDLDTPRMELRRLGIGADTSFREFKALVHD